MKRKKGGQITGEPNSVFSDMPFTPAHPAILLPLKKWRYFNISWTALIIGSIVPDFEYFIWMSSCASISHTLFGILIFNLPLTLILSYLYQRIIHPVLWSRLDFFKNSIQFEKYDQYFDGLRRNWLMFILSALIGIISHLIWDSFCHANGYMVHRIPFLLEVSRIGPYDVRNCYLLWYASSLLGCAGMAMAYLSMKKILSKNNWINFFNGRAFWGKILFLAIIIATVRIAIGLSWNWTRHLVIIALGSFFYATLIVCCLETTKAENPSRKVTINSKNRKNS